MDTIIVRGGQTRLTGEVTIEGAKNAVLPLLAATILASEGQTVLYNVPILSDVFTMNNVVRGLDIDVAFVDANKREYVAYYELLMPMMHSGSVMLADNTLWDGHVVEAAYANDAQTAAIRAFNDHVAADERVEQLILPERDGLSVIRVR